MRGWSNSRRQLSDCLVHRVVEFVQVLSFQSTAEGETGVGARLPKFDVIGLIGQRVLEPFQPAADQQRTRRPTLISVRRLQAGPRAALAGVKLTASFATFKATMAALNVAMAPLCSLGCWVLRSIVERGL